MLNFQKKKNYFLNKRPLLRKCEALVPLIGIYGTIQTVILFMTLYQCQIFLYYRFIIWILIKHDRTFKILSNTVLCKLL